MRYSVAALAAALAVVPVVPARADLPRLGLFRKKSKDDSPPQRAKQLVETLKTDPDERKRRAAAEELREQDPRNNSDIVPTLIAALQRDPSPDVRAEAAETIGKLKPVAQTAGVALEQTVVTDPVDGVRKAAQKALWDYHLNGYRSSGANPTYPQTDEPPLAKPRATAAVPPPVALPTKPTAAAPVQPRPITSGIGKGAIYPQTIEPPLAKSKPPRPVETLAPPTPSLTVPPLPSAGRKSEPAPSVTAPPAAASGPQTATKPAYTPPAAASSSPAISIPSIPPPPAPGGQPAEATPSIPVPAPPSGGSVLPLPQILTIPPAPTVPAGPTVPSIPPPPRK